MKRHIPRTRNVVATFEYKGVPVEIEKHDDSFFARYRLSAGRSGSGGPYFTLDGMKKAVKQAIDERQATPSP
jgi:hypothetical protein